MSDVVFPEAHQAETSASPSPWCLSSGKRIFDVLCSLILLVPALPIMGLAALAVMLTSPGPALFRQARVGVGGKPFTLLKLRTMLRAAAHSGPGVTRGGDQRITWLGAILRRTKLDELPQLFNVLCGQMSMVGPRPDLAIYMDTLHGSDRSILLLKPGITGCASLHFRHEEALLQDVPAYQLLDYYVRELLPRKVRLDLAYASRATWHSDVLLLLRTATRIFS